LVSQIVDKTCTSADTHLASIGETFVDQITERCFLFFSRGDHCEFKVSKLTEVVLTSMKSSRMLELDDGNLSLVNTIVNLLLESCRYWRTEEAVIDGTDVARKLNLNCSRLYLLGTEGRIGIVRLCIATARNFDPLISPEFTRSTALTLSNFADSRRDGLPRAAARSRNRDENWERELYHLDSLPSDDRKQAAVQSCFQIIMKYFVDLLGNGSVFTLSERLSRNSTGQQVSSMNVDSIELHERFIDSMASEIHDKCTTIETLRHIFYNTLLELRPDLLIKMNSHFIETFLYLNDGSYNHEHLFGYLLFQFITTIMILILFH
jgi:hypothetical protein